MSFVEPTAPSAILPITPPIHCPATFVFPTVNLFVCAETKPELTMIEFLRITGFELPSAFCTKPIHPPMFAYDVIVPLFSAPMMVVSE